MTTKNIYFIDFETRSTADLKKCGADVYASHPSTDILCMAYAFNDEPVKLSRGVYTNSGFETPLAHLFKFIREEGTIVGHNVGGFEFPIWNNIGVKKYGFPVLKREQLECTMAMSFAMSLQGSLENAAANMGIHNQKDQMGKRIMLQISQPRDIDPNGNPIWWEDQSKFDRLYEYCKKDVEIERELYKRLMQLNEFEKRVWQLDQKINSRGIKVDLKAAKLAQKLIQYEKARLDQEMREITNHEVATCTAVSQLTLWIKSQGIDTSGVTKADISYLLEKSDLPLKVRKALNLRQEAAKSSTAKIDAILSRTGNDERVRGLFQYHGAGTGRWAGRGVQVQNLPRSSMKQKYIDDVFTIMKGNENVKL